MTQGLLPALCGMWGMTAGEHLRSILHALNL